jgi:hypothetical protein
MKSGKSPLLLAAKNIWSKRSETYVVADYETFVVAMYDV